ncbi:MAG: electron transfer flavoprotein subunit beta/FixA family protein [Flavobacteriales bacterium]|nr:electron transfer flavoprotein subunit beta/FixA family protein [Flavobacteriales bacterium]MCW8914068.1 electron transfer flavoprotein subunit beta/FixA family protein [Flavobacteriales bacterium]MCW8938126.1 electron transfer flavoprotein subunit beta/FixA family protein [Flavobacteriales bacterium]MCW8939377.1 electron transfer flavoprotein subunit beta/FixA family protein [Flavobacteriales bacterium]MCW8968902.1 electron transfer flavoprotein subunit beta/FixA family protein [Flavobacter
MKIIVCISKAPDTTSKIAFADGNSKFDENGVQFIVNPYDEWYALVRALELKEANGGSVTVLNVGDASNDAIIRKALAIGADDAVRIDAPTQDALFVAKQIANYVKENNADMVLLGKETIDYNGSQVGGMIAAILDMPYVSLASKLDMNGTTATIEREIEGGVEVVETSTPFVLSAAKGMAEARIPNMRGIMAARTKPLNVVAAIDATNATEIKSFSLPPAKTGCKYVDADNVEQLIDLLHNEAKAI